MSGTSGGYYSVSTTDAAEGDYGDEEAGDSLSGPLQDLSLETEPAQGTKGDTRRGKRTPRKQRLENAAGTTGESKPPKGPRNPQSSGQSTQRTVASDSGYSARSNASPNAPAGLGKSGGRKDRREASSSATGHKTSGGSWRADPIAPTGPAYPGDDGYSPARTTSPAYGDIFTGTDSYGGNGLSVGSHTTVAHPVASPGGLGRSASMTPCQDDQAAVSDPAFGGLRTSQSWPYGGPSGGHEDSY